MIHSLNLLDTDKNEMLSEGQENEACIAFLTDLQNGIWKESKLWIKLHKIKEWQKYWAGNVFQMNIKTDQADLVQSLLRNPSSKISG